MPAARNDELEASIHRRFAKAALGLYGEEREFELFIPEGYDEVAVAAAFQQEGCDTTYLTPKRTIIVVRHDRSRL